MIEHMEVRIDEKVSTKEETQSLGIEVGDFISFDPFNNHGYACFII
jgi:putative aminopeptidase FrvX